MVDARAPLRALVLVVSVNGCKAADAHHAQPAEASAVAASFNVESTAPEPAVARGATTPMPVSESEMGASAPLQLEPPEQTRWTVHTPMSLAHLEKLWDIHPRELRRLNPELASIRGDMRPVPAGTRLRIFGPPGGAASRSVGRPNRGRLRYARPMPEGEAWALRTNRRRAWATPATIDAVTHAALALRTRFPDTPPVQLGEFSRRLGGRISPHKSHQSGRDVDIAYVLKPGVPLEDRGRFTPARPDTLDVERTWFFIQELLGTGQVQAIFVGVRLRRALYGYARLNTDSLELERLFRWTRRGGEPPAIIRSQRGHHDHMHVRFRCPLEHERCRG